MEPYKLRHSGKENSEIPTSSSEYPHIGTALSRLKAAMIVKGSHQAPIQRESFGVIPILKASTQRIAVACRGSWMPGASEVFGCPHIFFQSRNKTSDDLFSVIYLHFLPFYISFGCPLYPGCTFKIENWVVRCPQVGCRGRRAPRATLCTPLAHSI